MNRYPMWKYILLAVLIILGILYSAPNLFGEDPSVQVSGSLKTPVALVQDKMTEVLKTNQLKYKSVQFQDNRVLIRFYDTDTQLKANSLIKEALGDDYTVALNLAASTPHWLTVLGAAPMKLGLDLRGGVHFLLDVDVKSVIEKEQNGLMRQMAQELRTERIRYMGMNRLKNFGLMLQFRSDEEMNQAFSLLHRHFSQYQWAAHKDNGNFELVGELLPAALDEIRQRTIEQTMTILRNRVNELGVSEAIVQQQGLDRIAVDLPGVQDTARAKQILGGTATLEFRMVDEEHDPRNVVGGIAPIGSKLFTMRDGPPILLLNQVILSGNAITSANASFSEEGRPCVNITISGDEVSYFSRTTARSVGKRMGVVFIETKTKTTMVDGKEVKTRQNVADVISAPVIQQALGNSFRITNIEDPQEAMNLALFLRAGALLAPIEPIEERTVGPTLGQQNIHMGLMSVTIGMALVILFMLMYYHLFGVFADLALLLNLVLLVAILSVLGATLTLPGIAGIVLTVGMAVDANVLINERIREELRSGMSIQASIHAGYERAFGTIVDSNLTTMIVGLVLFGVGTGPVKGFAVTLTIGLLTSMLTAITFTRALVNWVYGRRQVKHISIGI